MPNEPCSQLYNQVTLPILHFQKHLWGKTWRLLFFITIIFLKKKKVIKHLLKPLLKTRLKNK
jgi:hypothetical protein